MNVRIYEKFVRAFGETERLYAREKRRSIR